MKAFDSVRIIGEEISRVFNEEVKGPLLVGISGPVASGKSRFVKRLISFLEKDLSAPLIHIPFDYWINKQGLGSRLYADRFFMNEFIDAIKFLAQCKPWMCPRYDIARSGLDLESLSFDKEMRVVDWSGRSFLPVSEGVEVKEIPFGNGIYLQVGTGRIFSRCIPQRNGLYILDGTLAFNSSEIVSCYAMRIYLASGWANRVARMVRRHNRKEVFGTTTLSEADYVGFLVKEARECADVEIEEQKPLATHYIYSSVDSISNLLELFESLVIITAIWKGTRCSTLLTTRISRWVSERVGPKYMPQ